MNNFKKYLFLLLFAFSAGLLSIGCASAQTWTSVYSVQNPCIANNGVVGTQPAGDSGLCQCPQGYTYGKAVNANCTMDGFVPGCWNPGTGKCNTCGQGGTIVLGQLACFNNGQANSGGGGASGVACTLTNSNGSSNQCIGSGTSTGGFSTN
jgi:hypothetical protein